jgi:hypothetical protein
VWLRRPRGTATRNHPVPKTDDTERPQELGAAALHQEGDVQASITRVIEQVEPALARFVRESLLIRGPLPEEAGTLLRDLAADAAEHKQDVQVLLALVRLEERHRSIEDRCTAMEGRMQIVERELDGVRSGRYRLRRG